MKKNYMRLIVALLFATNLMAQNIPNYVPTNGLVGWWPFNGNANDESGNGNHGTVNGATLTSDRNGILNKSYSFNGIDNNIILNPIILTNMSISIWFKKDNNLNTNPNYGHPPIGAELIGQGTQHQPSVTYSDFAFGISSYENKSDYFAFENNNLSKLSWTDYKLSDASSLSTNWQHAVITIQDTLLKFYLNGKIYNEQIISNPINNSGAPLSVGSRYVYQSFSGTGFSNFFNGLLDDIAIYNRALTQQEIKKLYEGCPKETATSTSFNSIIYTTNNPVNLSAVPSEGSFSGEFVTNNTFTPTKARLGKNAIKYNFKNSKGCLDSTDFSMLVVDTIGNICSVTKYDTVTIKKNVYDTIIVPKTVTTYDTVTVTKNVTKYDTITIKNNVYDTVKINKTIFDTVLVNKTIYDTLTVKNNVYDTITMTDTVSILKIKFKLTTGIYANQITSMSLYPNPTSDVLHIEVGDVTGLAGYRYRILDALGKEVYNELVKSAITEIPLMSLGAGGMYQFEVLDQKNTTIQTNKIVLQ